MAKVAFLGLGVMGYPMAGHLKNKGGHDVTVYNRTGAKAEKWVAQYGGRSAPTPKAAAEGQDFVMCCVGNDNDLREVTLGSNGAFHGMKKDAVFVDHTTASAEIARELEAQAKERKQQVGSGDRSEKIRTYNFPQNRLTDHRIGLTIHQLSEVMEGKLQPIVDALIAHYNAERMKAEATEAAA